LKHDLTANESKGDVDSLIEAVLNRTHTSKPAFIFPAIRSAGNGYTQLQRRAKVVVQDTMFLDGPRRYMEKRSATAKVAMLNTCLTTPEQVAFFLRYIMFCSPVF
jgi:hypothetical protein